MPRRELRGMRGDPASANRMARSSRRPLPYPGGIAANSRWSSAANTTGQANNERDETGEFSEGWEKSLIHLADVRSGSLHALIFAEFRWCRCVTFAFQAHRETEGSLPRHSFSEHGLWRIGVRRSLVAGGPSTPEMENGSPGGPPLHRTRIRKTSVAYFFLFFASSSFSRTLSESSV